MPNLILRLETDPEDAIEGWHLADGHWDEANGIGVLVIVSPDRRRQILAGKERTLTAHVVEHCAAVVVERRRDPPPGRLL